MTISQVQIYEIVKMTQENQSIYERRVLFQNYCKKQLGIKTPINTHINYQNLFNDTNLSEKELLLINSNTQYFKDYYKDINQEISNNKKILSIIKDTVFLYIKNKEFVSLKQIKKYCNMYYVADFYIWFLINHLVSQNELSPLKNGDIIDVIYKNNIKK